MFKLDDLLKDLGEFGPYQKKVFALTCTIIFFNSWASMIQVFLAASVDHWCATTQWECVEEELAYDECELLKKQASIPSNYTSDGELEYAQCEKYNVSGVGFWPGIDPSNYSSGATQTMKCDQGWIYDTSQYKSSIVTDFDLVCGKDDLIQVSQSVFFGGYFIGSLVFGSLADIIGRWWSLMICIILRLVSGIALAFSPNWWVFTVVRFAQGCATISMYIIAFIIATEFTGPSKRNIAGIIFVIPFAIGYVCLGLVAYFLRYWRTLEIVATVPVFGMVVLMYWLPESVRWHISKGRYDKAEKTIDLIAKSNKKSIPRPIFTSEDIIQKKEYEEKKPRQYSMLDLFRTPNLRKRSVNLAFIWMVNAVVYHGLSLSTSNLGVNDYVAFAISGAVEIPSYVFASFVIEFFGRPRSLSFLLILSGVSLLATSVVRYVQWGSEEMGVTSHNGGILSWLCLLPYGLVPWPMALEDEVVKSISPLTILQGREDLFLIGYAPGPGLVTIAMIGKFGISAAFAVVFLYTVELYPTSFRSSAMGAFSMFARVAGIISPLVLTLAKYWRPLPLVIYGAAGLAVGLSTLLLPETQGKKLPDTLEEGENCGRIYFQIEKDGTAEEVEPVKKEQIDEPV